MTTSFPDARLVFSRRLAVGLSRRRMTWIIALSVLAGVIQSAAYIGAAAQPGLWQAAARGLQGPTNPVDSLAGIAWSWGGTTGLAFWQWAQVFLVTTFFALSLLILAEWISGFLPKKRSSLLGSAALLLIALWSGWTAWENFARRPILAAPLALSQPVELAAEILSEKTGDVFATPSALTYLQLTRPELVSKLSVPNSAELSRKARSWREALRTEGWRSVILAGPISEYRSLLDHLLISPDWRLARISNQGFLFQRETGAPVGNIDPQTIDLGTSRDTAVYLAQIAERYEAVRRTAEARSFSKLAIEAAPNDVEVLSHTAVLESLRGKWYDAILFCDRALKIDPNSSYLRLLKASCLLEIKQADKAEWEAQQVLARSPDDPYTLFLYARIARIRHDSKTEAETLERLIKVTPDKEIPVNYFVFLGQAYAQMGQPQLAIDAYQKALSRPDMGPELGNEIRGQIKNIEAKTGR